MSRPQDDREHVAGHAPAESQQSESAAPSSSPLERLASSAGNQGMSETIARTPGAGILDGGRVHPEVQNTIDSRRGGGGSLDSNVAQDLGGKLGTDLSGVRVHNDDTADQLARSVSARAFATGNDMYFAKGEYNPGTSEGRKLIAHEAVHTVQQRGAPSGPLTVSNPGDAMESEADSVADKL